MRLTVQLTTDNPITSVMQHFYHPGTFERSLSPRNVVETSHATTLTTGPASVRCKSTLVGAGAKSRLCGWQAFRPACRASATLRGIQVTEPNHQWRAVPTISTCGSA